MSRYSPVVSSFIHSISSTWELIIYLETASLSLLIFSLLGWGSPPALQWFFGGHVSSGKMLAQDLGMHSTDGLQYHPIQGLFHGQRTIHPGSLPVLEWSTFNDWFIRRYESPVISVQHVTILASQFSLRLPVGSGEAIVGSLRLDFSTHSFPYPSSVVLRCASQGCKHSSGQSVVQSAFWDTPSAMGGFMNHGSHEPVHFVYRPRYFGRASRMDGYLG